MLVIGHRGAAGHAPEHTIESYDLALAMRADYIELDLQLTQDGALVVLHDDTLDRTTTCTGLVIEKTVDEVRRCGVLSLRDVFKRYGMSGRYYIEIKSPEDAPGMEKKLLGLITEFGLQARVIVESFNRESVLKIRALDAELPLVQLTDDKHDSRAVRARLTDISSYALGVAPHRLSVDAALIDAAHDVGLVLHPYTVNEIADMKRMIALGVDGMFTDYPDRLSALLR